jgi:mannose-6-phosphate isomerase-like protein (cupin superfamily)
MKSIWVTSSNKQEKPWGNEAVWATGGNSRIIGKVLFLKKGCRNSLKYNVIKDETLFVMTGKLLLTFADEGFAKHKIWKTREVRSGETINIQSGCPYRIKAMKDSTIIEIGTRAGHSSTVRFHDDYGRHCSSSEFEVYKQADDAEKRISKLEDI